ncbi:type II secretion system protein GspC [Salinisphaera sp. Q1T1-3]|uniref:type II secretion system protein GspC n=1 Tax=Salinisphaera sp. Q1T1-3 TaxID=2321229 RepID=UPI000E7593F1|nr:type II secretion system protein GspC [Salinisphaera sp. Q1T1-3]RJS91755.1 type II secretion system protein GspC [Salinisphaera sp. Q1T1-3]
MSIELSPQAQRWLARLPDIANVVLIALLALSLAHLFWLVWPQSVPEAIAPADASSNSRAANENKIDVEAIASAHIFGEQKIVDVDLEKQKERNAPETHLNLTLTGIIADSQGNQSRALIKNPQNEQDGYRVGQSIVSGVELHAIYPAKVILDRNGRFETLTLESVKKAQSLTGLQRQASPSATARSSRGQADTASAGGSPSSNGDLGSQLSDVRRKIMADPSSAQRYIRLQPERQDGNLVGYRIFPGQDKSLFDKAGLKSGELVTAINGQSLDNPAASLKMLGNLAHASSATITVQDGGQSRTVRVDFQ